MESRYGRAVAARLRRLETAKAVGEPNAWGEAGTLACGSLIRIDLLVQGGVVQESSSRAYGCPATLACAAEVAERVRKATFLEAACLSEVELRESLELAPDHFRSAQLGIEALQSALTKAIDSGLSMVSHAGAPDEGGVLVGMSGGVDSAVAALILKSGGYHVVGVTLALSPDASDEAEKSCCSPTAVRRARQVAHGLGIPHLMVDARRLFAERVIDYFVNEYSRGRTPNPCAKCNSLIRFEAMTKLAAHLRLAHVATGHYARKMGEPSGLAMAADLSKDQSYVLAEVSPTLVDKLMFPLAELTKAEVRAMAEAAGLLGHDAPESQEICFITNDDYRGFLRARLGERPGNITDREGRVLARHSGTYNYTVGQRKGLGFSSTEPRYVVALDYERDEVMVGGIEECKAFGVELEGLVWHRAPRSHQCSTKVRSAGDAIASRLECCLATGSEFEAPPSVVVRFEQPACGVSTGQTAVVYEGPHVVVAGTIVSSLARGSEEA